MKHLSRFSLVVAATAVLFSAACGSAAKVEVGQKAPEWSGVIGVDDQTHSLADYKKAKLVVLVFTCNHCPVAQVYEDRLIALQKDYASKGAQVVAVSVNSVKVQPQDSFDLMKKRAEEKEFPFPYLYDPTQQMGRDYGAAVTPQVFVLDKERNIAYMGGIDDNNNAGEVKEHWLRDALDELLAGKPAAKAETKARGCSIKWDSN